MRRPDDIVYDIALEREIKKLEKTLDDKKTELWKRKWEREQDKRRSR